MGLNPDTKCSAWSAFPFQSTSIRIVSWVYIPGSIFEKLPSRSVDLGSVFPFRSYWVRRYIQILDQYSYSEALCGYGSRYHLSIYSYTLRCKLRQLILDQHPYSITVWIHAQRGIDWGWFHVQMSLSRCHLIHSGLWKRRDGSVLFFLLLLFSLGGCQSAITI